MAMFTLWMLYSVAKQRLCSLSELLILLANCFMNTLITSENNSTTCLLSEFFIRSANNSASAVNDSYQQILIL